MRFALLGVLAAATPAHAFQIESSLTSSCHEDVTHAAAARAGFPAEGAPPPTEDQRRAMADLPFALRRQDLWMMALLIGVRSNDVGEFDPSSVTDLVNLHNDPAAQREHCLRAKADNGPDGDVMALASCRAFILEQLELAGLLADGPLDLATIERVRVYLAFRGTIAVELPRFAFRAGRALHALQDAYTHTFRDPDTAAVTHVLNWVDSVRGGYHEDVDGHAHITTLDDCGRTDPRMTRRLDRATAASAALLAAIGDPAPGRRARVEVALDAAFAYRPGCELGNRYCDAEELIEESEGCSVVQPALVVVVAFGMLRRRRRA